MASFSICESSRKTGFSFVMKFPRVCFSFKRVFPCVYLPVGIDRLIKKIFNKNQGNQFSVNTRLLVAKNDNIRDVKGIRKI